MVTPPLVSRKAPRLRNLEQLPEVEAHAFVGDEVATAAFEEAFGDQAAERDRKVGDDAERQLVEGVPEEVQGALALRDADLGRPGEVLAVEARLGQQMGGKAGSAEALQDSRHGCGRQLAVEQALDGGQFLRDLRSHDASRSDVRCWRYRPGRRRT
jgi:hypothetical protein